MFTIKKFFPTSKQKSIEPITNTKEIEQIYPPSTRWNHQVPKFQSITTCTIENLHDKDVCYPSSTRWDHQVPKFLSILKPITPNPSYPSPSSQPLPQRCLTLPIFTTPTTILSKSAPT